MMFSRHTGVLLTLNSFVAAIQYDGPAATPSIKGFSADGWSPKPTGGPIMELFRRQEDPSFCGYLEGDAEAPISCDVGSSCMYNKAFSWFGCCTGTAITDCEVATACVESTKVSDCLKVSSCANDPLAIGCTRSAAPFCMQLYTVVSGATYGHFACGATDVTAEVLSSATTGGASTGKAFTTRSSRSTKTEDDSKSSSGDSSSSDSSTAAQFSFSLASGTTANVGTVTRLNIPTTKSASTGGAMKTAEAVLGAAGGVAGLLALLA
ncbi:uncharacterized protein BDR25DRAFT_338811 [Lindgomyces ingoldianus]|uniref:Uncharacterized protein n=1 Tax=Lindgomyces ingoldianus TaxID=673940 RepID=A0ACB6RI25_9PLEO|nr:uncharacterized protein BDR25DRAFT_338811 [Lindgomyces ingoldianus]KAF2478167.1 hypothetical protein BDR25DRAFT_338811 [Lindgomyces ingoldianus]